VVSKPGGRTEELAMHLRHALADLGVEVTAATLDEVAADLRGWLPRLQKAQCVVSLMFDVQQARALLAPRGIEVMPLLGALREDTREKIISLPAGTRVGIVSGSLDFVDGMITAATSLNPGLDITGACDSSDQPAITQLLGESDCIVYGTLARQVIDRQLPSSAEGIELIYIPDDTSIQRLRRLLRDERP
jgi:hypothetical protein